MMRRDFIAGVAGTAIAGSLPARAQQQAMPIIGFLGAPAKESYLLYTDAIRRGLKELGYIEGRNVGIEYRWAENQYERLPSLAAELIGRQVALIVTIGGAPAALAAKAATSTIPVIFHMGADPVQLGLVASFNRPGGNITGATLLGVALDAKRLELLHELVPSTRSIALLMNPTNPQTAGQIRDVQGAAGVIERQISIVHASNEREIESAFATFAERNVGGLLVGADTFLGQRARQIATLALRQGLPTVTQSREFALLGGLMSYAPDIADVYRQVGVYAGRILQGEKPADLPITQPTSFQLVINLSTAKALRLEIPPSLLARAEEVIE